MPWKSPSTQRPRLRFHGVGQVSYDFYGPKTMCKAKAGDEVNGFKLEETLGAGAFGTTWRARATNQSDLKSLNLEEGMYVEHVCTAVFQDGVIETTICNGPWDVFQGELLHKHRTCTMYIIVKLTLAYYWEVPNIQFNSSKAKKFDGELALPAEAKKWHWNSSNCRHKSGRALAASGVWLLALALNLSKMSQQKSGNL